MNPILIAAVVLAFTFGGALLGLWIRTKLPEHHVIDATKDTVKLGIGMVATMTALVLGLVTASAKNSFDSVDSAVKHTAIDLLTLDRLLARYGPEAAPTRSALKTAVGGKIEQLWPTDASKSPQVDPAPSGVALESLVDSMRTLTPQNDAQRRLQSRALDLGESLLTTRWLAVADQTTSIPFAFLVILLFWLLDHLRELRIVCPAQRDSAGCVVCLRTFGGGGGVPRAGDGPAARRSHQGLARSSALRT